LTEINSKNLIISLRAQLFWPNLRSNREHAYITFSVCDYFVAVIR